MLPAEVPQDRIQVTDKFHVHALLLVSRNLIPARLGPVAVIVPLEKRNIVLRQQLVEKSLDVIAHI